MEEFAIGSVRLHYVQNSLWKGLWTCHETGDAVTFRIYVEDGNTKDSGI